MAEKIANGNAVAYLFSMDILGFYVRLINFGNFEAPKIAISTILAPLNFEYLVFFSVKFTKIKAFKIVKMALFDHQ